MAPVRALRTVKASGRAGWMQCRLFQRHVTTSTPVPDFNELSGNLLFKQRSCAMTVVAVNGD